MSYLTQSLEETSTLYSQDEILYDPHPDTVQQWLENLPKAHIHKASALVYASLTKLKHNNIVPKDWFRSLEQFNPVIQFLSKMLNQQYLEDSSLKPQKKRTIMALALAIQLEIADAYCFLVTKQTNQLNIKYITKAIHYALNHLKLYLLRSYQLYKEPPKQVYSIINTLYSFSETNLLEQNGFQDENNNTTTIHTVFKSIILLMTCNPYQLIPQDVEKLYVKLLEWAELSELNKKIKNNDLYILDLSSDIPPSYKKIFQGEETQTSLRGFNTAPLIENLQLHTYDADTKNTSGVSEALLQHLIRTWDSFPTRKFTRSTASGSVNACVGLSTVYYYLNNQNEKISPPENTSRISAKKSKLQGNIKPENEKLKILPISPETSSENMYSGNIQNPAHSQDPWKIAYQKGAIPTSSQNTHVDKPLAHQWELLNSSANGYCLCTSSDYPDELKAGKLVGLQENISEDNDTYWLIGLIRWIKYTDDDQLLIGIELLAPNAIAVGIQNKEQQRNHYKLLRAMLLPDIPPLEQPQTLIVPKIPYKEGDIVRIANQYIDIDIQLSKCINNSNFFNRFIFEIIEHYYDEKDFFEKDND